MKALIIGGTGIISSAIVRRLVEKKWDVYVLNRGNRSSILPEEVKQIIVDINDEEKVKALRLYLELKGCKLEDELTKIIETLYTKIVPTGVREYIGMSFGEEPACSESMIVPISFL